MFGVENGQARASSGPTYQVSQYGVNHSEWATVSPEKYRREEANFVRSGALAIIGFGGVALILEINLLRWRRASG
jgi:hypothetical protein